MADVRASCFMPVKARLRRIEDYAVIGDGHGCALVHRRGSIDWLCWPRFDSPACLAALLGDAEHGQWALAPRQGRARVARRYRPDTLILETEYTTASGRVRVVDCMPIHDGTSAIVRLVVGLEGTVPMRHRLALRFDHGRIRPWVDHIDGGFCATLGPDRVVLHASVPTSNDTNASLADFIVQAGDHHAFVLSHHDAGSAHAEDPTHADAARLVDATADHWRDLCARFVSKTDWPDVVGRSLIVLHALIDRTTGALVAAPTTSLPEIEGGSSNWDYRYCWLRDASFTVAALLNAGLETEAIKWRDWLLQVLGPEPEKLRIAYRVDGTTHLDESTIDWLPGYGGARPVRTGNAAWNQHQVDVYGELLDALNLIKKAGIPGSSRSEFVEDRLVEHLVATWDNPGQGLWESRDAPKHYVYSKVMAWVGIDCYLKGTRIQPIRPAARRRLEAVRAAIHADVCANGYHAKRRTFVQHYGSGQLDASLLLLPLVGFLPADDPRIERTIDAIERELMVDGFVMRLKTKPGKPSEGAFLACTCWLADCRSMQGRRAEALALFERVSSIANDVGLLSEEYDPIGRRLAGNFPQALTHLAVINTALGLSGSVLQRGGG